MELDNVTNKESNKSLRMWLFNPFDYLAGLKALLIGILLMLLSGLIASFGKVHFDGVLDAHFGATSPLWVYLSEGIIDWVILSFFLFIGGAIISSSRYRIIDVFGTQALARFPMIVTAIVLLPPQFRRFILLFVSQPNEIGKLISQNTVDFILFIVVIIIMIFMVIWMISLMYKAYSVSFNVKGGKAIFVFIASLLLAEIVSKVVFISAAKIIYLCG